MEAVRKRVVVSGRVQGVFYRASAERAAWRLGVSGFARNQWDGSVLLEVEGEPAAVDAMIAWCRVGPRRAHVHSVTVENLAPLGSRGFRTD